jgi:hypothetical protein
MTERSAALLALAMLFLPACAGMSSHAVSSTPGSAHLTPAATAAGASSEPAPLLGHIGRRQIEEAVPSWVEAEVASRPDASVAGELAEVEPGAEVTVFLGTWCSDSRREVSRLWRALDEVGDPELPFRLVYVGVDRAKQQPADLIAGADLRYVPTFIVRRGGAEVGRIVEEAPDGIERDLLSLLTGEAHGLLTGRQDLRQAKAADPRGRF